MTTINLEAETFFKKMPQTSPLFDAFEVNVLAMYPNRFTHHVIIQDPGEVDAELMGWIKEAYEFSEKK